MNSRRDFLLKTGLTALGASLVSKVQAAGIPEAMIQTEATTQPPVMPVSGLSLIHISEPTRPY